MPTACAAAPSRVRSSVAERDRQPLALVADQVLGRHADVLEDRRAGRRAVDAELVLELADREARAVLLDDERAEAPVLAVGHREDDVEVGDAGVGDPVLGAVDDPLVAVAARRSCASPRRPSRPRARTGRTPATTRRWRTCGRKRSFSSSEPNSAIGSVPSSWTIRISALDAHALAISSTAIWSISVPVPVPPYSSAKGSARMSCSASSLRMSHGYSPLASISAARGRDRSRRRSGGSCRGSPCAPAGARRRRSAVVLMAHRRAGHMGVATSPSGNGSAHGHRRLLFLIAVGAILRYAVSDAIAGSTSRRSA